MQETYLPYIIRSKLKLLLSGENDQTLLTFIDEAMKTEQKKAIIEMHYSQELSLLYILQDDFDRAKYYISNGMQIFMQVIMSSISGMVFFCVNSWNNETAVAISAARLYSQEKHSNTMKFRYFLCHMTKLLLNSLLLMMKGE